MCLGFTGDGMWLVVLAGMSVSWLLLGTPLLRPVLACVSCAPYQALLGFLVLCQRTHLVLVYVQPEASLETSLKHPW